METRASTGLWLGVTGAAVGLAGVVTGSPVAALAAGACALAAGLVSVRQGTALRATRGLAAALAIRVGEIEPDEAAAEEAGPAEHEAQEPGGAAQPPPEAAAGAHPWPSPVSAPGAGSPSGVEAVLDPVTGMYNEVFFRVTLDQRVLAARRHLRPVALVLLDVVRTIGQGQWAPADPVMVATALRTTLREADTSCRLSDGHFALLLEDTPEDGAVWTVERVRRALLPGHPELVVWAGVACYPAHAFDAMEVLERAADALVAAREWRRDRIEVAPSPD